MSLYAPYCDVLDGPAGALQDESVGDLGRGQALRATDELKGETVHLSLLAHISSGKHTLRNYLLFRLPLTRSITRWLWARTQPPSPEGINVADAAEIRRRLRIPVLCTGGFQSAASVRHVIENGLCDGVSIARPLLANPNLVQVWARGSDLPDRPCSYCNSCLFHVLEDPLGCYDLRRYDGDRDRMVRELMAFYQPDGFGTGMPAP